MGNLLKVSLPRNRFTEAVYPYVDPDKIGQPIPIAYGTLTGLVPTEIDTTTHRYKIVDQAVQEITCIRSATKDPLVKDTDYQEYLTLGEFRLTYNAKFKTGDYYYFAIAGDYAISDSAYLAIGQNNGIYADGGSYVINGSGVWSTLAPGNALRFELRGQRTGAVWASGDSYEIDDYVISGAYCYQATTAGITGSTQPVHTSGTVSDGAVSWHYIGAAEVLIASNTTDTTTGSQNLRDSAAATKVGQKFKPGAGTTGQYDYYPTRLRLLGGSIPDNTPSGNIWVVFYKAISPEDIYAALGTPGSAAGFSSNFNILVAGWDTLPEITCDIKAPGTELTKVADIVPDLLTNIMGKSSSLLDATELANLDADRTEDLKISIGDETDFGSVIAKLEAGQLWKLIPLQDGTYGTIVYETGEPANTPHFRDKDFLSFSMELDASFLKYEAVVYYDQDPTNTEVYPAVAVQSDVAKFFYANEESVGIETYLKDAADADTLADSYVARYEVPIIKVTFEVHGWALDLLPGRDKVKITHTRAAYAGGTLSGVLFRIIKLTKRPETNVVKIVAAVWGNSAT